MNIISIDAGGTKTSITLYNENGNLIRNIIVDTINVFQKETNESVEILNNGIKEISENLVGETIIVLGVAGYGINSEAVKKIDNICKIALSDYEYKIYSDIEIALNGAINGENGIVIIAGTGSIALAKKNDEYYRVGGFGYFLGDEGSGYYISKKILNIFTKQIDNRLPKTILYNKVFEELSLGNELDILKVMNMNKKNIASLSHLIEYAPNSLYDEVVDELALMVNTLIKKFDDDKIIVSYIGGVFKNKKILELLKNKCPRAIFIEPINSPEYGGYLLLKKNN